MQNRCGCSHAPRDARAGLLAKLSAALRAVCVWIPSRRNATYQVGASPCSRQGRSALTPHEAPLELFRVVKADANERAEQAEVCPGDGALDVGTKLGALGSKVCWLSWTFPNPPLSAITCTKLEWYSFCWPLEVGHACCYLRTQRRRQLSTEEDVAGSTWSNIGGAERCCACSVTSGLQDKEMHNNQ